MTMLSPHKAFLVLAVLTLCGCTAPSDLHGQWYANPTLGFAMIVPEGWHLPATDDRQPIFWENTECFLQHTPSCGTFFVTIRSEQEAENPDELLTTLSRAHPVEMTSRMTGARIISADVLNPGESGYKFQYHFFFPDTKTGLNVVSNTREIDDALKTIKLSPDLP